MRSILLILALATAACSQQTTQTADTADRSDTPGPAVASTEPPLEPIPRDESAGRSGTDSMTWIYGPPGQYEPGRPASLMYSARASDETLFAMHCEGDNVRVIMMRTGVPQNYPFTLRSGDARVDLTGSGERGGGEDPLGEARVEATTPTGNPVFARMRDGGEFSLIEQSEEFPANAINDAERQAIRDFFTACA